MLGYNGATFHIFHLADWLLWPALARYAMFKASECVLNVSLLSCAECADWMVSVQIVMWQVASSWMVQVCARKHGENQLCINVNQLRIGVNRPQLGRKTTENQPRIRAKRRESAANQSRISRELAAN